jgi:hypothetical protein
MDAFLHVGAPKCGSSAIQEYFSRYPTGRCAHGETYSYCCLMDDSILLPSQVRDGLFEYITGYGHSEMRATIPAEQALHLKSRLQGVDGQLVFSQESWMLGFMDPHFREQVVDIAQGIEKRRVHLIGFVRPPVKWINSSWWQWGAWGDGVDLDRWVAEMTDAARWSDFCIEFSRDPSFCSVKFMPVRENVVTQFAQAAMIEETAEMNIRGNASLPAEVLDILLRSDRLRSDPHDCLSDFVALGALKGSPFRYSPTPWILEKRHVKQIIEQTRDSVQALLPFLSPDDRATIEADASWWSEDYYDQLMQPVQEASSVECLLDRLSRSQNLSEDLLVQLVEANKILAENKLLGNL